MESATQRFTSRVDDYVKSRPGYPAELGVWARDALGLSAHHRVADLGAGTGLLARVWLAMGCDVIGVEPNHAMREAGDRELEVFPRYRSVDGTAEATTLEAGSIDYATAGQAFHWFDAARVHEELRRVLAKDKGGFSIFVWNDRRADGSPFHVDYEKLLRDHAPEYLTRPRPEKGDGAEVAAFFAPNTCIMHEMPNAQRFDFEGLLGRLLSSSYSPQLGHPGHEPMVEDLRRVFERHAEDGVVTFEYTTKIFAGSVF